MDAMVEDMTEQYIDDASDAQVCFEDLAQRCEGSNVNPRTLLATDYLNHFNEIIMLFDMVPDMPDILEECREWQPKSYQDHFRDSAIADKDLAVEAYDHVPTEFKQPFEATIAQMDQLVPKSMDRMDDAISRDANEELAEVAKNASRDLQTLSDRAGAIIHGSQRTMEQDEIDNLLST